MDEFLKPVFLSAELAESLDYGGNESPPLFDHELDITPTAIDDTQVTKPQKAVISRYQEVARYHALGLTNMNISKKLGYSSGSVSQILRHPFTQSEIRRMRDQVMDGDMIAMLRSAGKDSIRLIHNIILDDNAKMGHRLDAAKWAKEQALGKAHQSHTIENNTLNVYVETMREMRRTGEAIDIIQISAINTPQPIKEINAQTIPPSAPQILQHNWDDWLSQNLK